LNNLNVLVVGGGGREHALAWSLARSPEVGHVFVAPGNAGTNWPANPSATDWQTRAGASCVAIEADNIPALVSFAQEQAIDLTIIGPEGALASGVVDAFQAAELRVFGPTQAAAQLESSKAFAKQFMIENDIPTAAYGAFEDFDAARQFVRDIDKPVVVKADGLAAGKGVIVCDDGEQAEAALRRIMVEREFGESGVVVVIEERLTGREVSALAFSDGRSVALMPLARDHKRIFDQDCGPNTGGMGAFTPLPDADEGLHAFINEVLQRAIDGLAKRGTPYMGVLYAGLMLTPNGPKVLEFNCRFGDPETQCIVPMLNDSLARILIACTESRLDEIPVRWHDGACISVVLASGGYPGRYRIGLPIDGLTQAADDVVVFHAGTSQLGEQVVTAGGRVLAISAKGSSLADARQRAYEHLECVQFSGMQYRRDIGEFR